MLFLALVQGFIFYQNKITNPPPTADSIIILGAHIEGNSIKPSLIFRYRLDKVVEYCHDNLDVLDITTGGKTSGYSQSKADVMQ